MRPRLLSSMLTTTLEKSRQAKLEKKAWPNISRPGAPQLGKKQDFFLGEEVERSPFFGKATLFVVKLRKTEVIVALAEQHAVFQKKVSHIYLGANKSYESDARRFYVEQAKKLIAQGYCVTLDVPFQEAKDFVEDPLLQDKKFVLMLSLHCPHLEKLKKRAVLKLDDVFLGANGGVLVHPLSSLVTDTAFTPWGWYRHDKVLR